MEAVKIAVVLMQANISTGWVFFFFTFTSGIPDPREIMLMKLHHQSGFEGQKGTAVRGEEVKEALAEKKQSGQSR